LLCMFVLVLVKKTNSWNKGIRFLSSACSDPPEISLPAASEFLCSGLGSASRGNRGSTAVSRTFHGGLSKHPKLSRPGIGFWVLCLKRGRTASPVIAWF